MDIWVLSTSSFWLKLDFLFYVENTLGLGPWVPNMNPKGKGNPARFYDFGHNTGECAATPERVQQSWSVCSNLGTCPSTPERVQ